MARIGECRGAANKRGAILVAHLSGDHTELFDAQIDQLGEYRATRIGKFQQRRAAVGRRRAASDQARIGETVTEPARSGRHQTQIVAEFTNHARTAAIKGLKRAQRCQADLSFH